MDDTRHERARDSAHQVSFALERRAADDARDRAWTRWAVGLAVAVHLALYAGNWSVIGFAGELPPTPERRQDLFLVQPFNLKLSPPPTPKKWPRMPGWELSFGSLDERELPRVSERGWPAGAAEPMQEPEPELERPMRFARGGPLSEPVRLSGPEPTYPEAARRARIQGVVLVECVIDAEGQVTGVKVLRGLPLGMTESAVEAVRQWRFEPSLLDGRPVEVVYVQTVPFVL